MSTRTRLAVSALVGLLGATALGAAGPAPRRDDDRKELARARIDIARRQYQQIAEGLTRPLDVAAPAPVPGVVRLVAWSQRWAEAEADLADTPEARIAAYQKHLERLETWARSARQIAKGVGARIGPYDIAEVDYAVLEARSRLVDLKRP
jgi:hypothetical protein